jgi:hypothetical protein
MFLLQGDYLRACRSPVAGLAEERSFSRVFGHAGQSTDPKVRHPWRVLSFGMWCHATSNPSLKRKVSNKFLRGMFKFRTEFIQHLFNESLVFWFSFFLSKNDLPIWIYLRLCEKIFLIWNCNILKFMPECSPSYSYMTSFHADIIHASSLFQRVSDACYFDIRNNTTES